MFKPSRGYRIFIDCCIILTLSAFAAPALADSCSGVRVSVNTSLNVRSGPGSNYVRIGVVYNNQIYYRLGTASNGWIRIQLDSRSGYVHPSYVVPGSYGNCKRVTASSLNIRSGPGTSYAVVGSAANNTRWFSNGSSGSWTRIYYGGAQRWGYATYLVDSGTTNPPGGGDVNVADYVAFVTASALNVRSGPGTNHPVIGQLANNARVTVTHHNGNWRRISAGSTSGYVHSAYLVRESDLQPPPRISNFRINDGASSTSSRNVTLRFGRSGTRPTQYRVSQRSDFAGATWRSYTYPIAFTLSAGVGGKRVYFQARDGYRRVSNRVNDWIELVLNCSLQTPAAFTYNETILPSRDNVVVRTQPRVDACTDTGERVDIDADERMRVRGEQNGWFYIDAIVNLNGAVLRSAAGWVHNSDVGTNEAVRISWNDGGVGAWNMDVTIRVDDTTDKVFFNQQFGWNHGGAGYFGFQQFPEGRKFIFSLFASTADGPGAVLDFNSDFDCQIASDEPGVAGPLRCLDDFNWSVGQQYTLRLWRLGDEPGGTRWGAWVRNANGNDIFKVGDFLVKHSSSAPHFITSVVSFLEDFDNGRDCSVPGSTRFHVARPSFNAGASRATYAGDSIGPCSNGSTAASTRFSGGRELRFNVN